MLTIKQAIDNYLRDLAVGQSAQTVETYSQGLSTIQEFLSIARRTPRAGVPLDRRRRPRCAKWLSEARPGAPGGANRQIDLADLPRQYLAALFLPAT